MTLLLGAPERHRFRRKRVLCVEKSSDELLFAALTVDSTLTLTADSAVAFELSVNGFSNGILPLGEASILHKVPISITSASRLSRDQFRIVWKFDHSALCVQICETVFIVPVVFRQKDSHGALRYEEFLPSFLGETEGLSSAKLSIELGPRKVLSQPLRSIIAYDFVRFIGAINSEGNIVKVNWNGDVVETYQAAPNCDLSVFFDIAQKMAVSLGQGAGSSASSNALSACTSMEWSDVLRVSVLLFESGGIVFTRSLIGADFHSSVIFPKEVVRSSDLQTESRSTFLAVNLIESEVISDSNSIFLAAAIKTESVHSCGSLTMSYCLAIFRVSKDLAGIDFASKESCRLSMSIMHKFELTESKEGFDDTSLSSSKLEHCQISVHHVQAGPVVMVYLRGKLYAYQVMNSNSLVFSVDMIQSPQTSSAPSAPSAPSALLPQQNPSTPSTFQFGSILFFTFSGNLLLITESDLGSKVVSFPLGYGVSSRNSCQSFGIFINVSESDYSLLEYNKSLVELVHCRTKISKIIVKPEKAQEDSNDSFSLFKEYLVRENPGHWDVIKLHPALKREIISCRTHSSKSSLQNGKASVHPGILVADSVLENTWDFWVKPSGYILCIANTSNNFLGLRKIAHIRDKSYPSIWIYNKQNKRWRSLCLNLDSNSNAKVIFPQNDSFSLNQSLDFQQGLRQSGSIDISESLVLESSLDSQVSDAVNSMSAPPKSLSVSLIKGDVSSVVSVAWYNEHSIIVLSVRRSRYCLEIMSKEAVENKNSVPKVHKIIILPSGFMPNQMDVINVGSGQFESPAKNPNLAFHRNTAVVCIGDASTFITYRVIALLSNHDGKNQSNDALNGFVHQNLSKLSIHDYKISKMWEINLEVSGSEHSFPEDSSVQHSFIEDPLFDANSQVISKIQTPIQKMSIYPFSRKIAGDLGGQTKSSINFAFLDSTGAAFHFNSLSNSFSVISMDRFIDLRVENLELHSTRLDGMDQTADRNWKVGVILVSSLGEHFSSFLWCPNLSGGDQDSLLRIGSIPSSANYLGVFLGKLCYFDNYSLHPSEEDIISIGHDHSSRFSLNCLIRESLNGNDSKIVRFPLKYQEIFIESQVFLSIVRAIIFYQVQAQKLYRDSILSQDQVNICENSLYVSLCSKIRELVGFLQDWISVLIQIPSKLEIFIEDVENALHLLAESHSFRNSILEYRVITSILYFIEKSLLFDIISRLSRKLEPHVSRKLFPIPINIHSLHGYVNFSSSNSGVVASLTSLEIFVECLKTNKLSQASRILTLACDFIGGSETVASVESCCKLSFELLHRSLLQFQFSLFAECLEFTIRLENILFLLKSESHLTGNGESLPNADHGEIEMGCSGPIAPSFGFSIFNPLSYLSPAITYIVGNTTLWTLNVLSREDRSQPPKPHGNNNLAPTPMLESGSKHSEVDSSPKKKTDSKIIEDCLAHFFVFLHCKDRYLEQIEASPGVLSEYPVSIDYLIRIIQDLLASHSYFLISVLMKSVLNSTFLNSEVKKFVLLSRRDSFSKNLPLVDLSQMLQALNPSTEISLSLIQKLCRFESIKNKVRFRIESRIEVEFSDAETDFRSSKGNDLHFDVPFRAQNDKLILLKPFLIGMMLVGESGILSSFIQWLSPALGEEPSIANIVEYLF